MSELNQKTIRFVAGSVAITSIVMIVDATIIVVQLIDAFRMKRQYPFAPGVTSRLKFSRIFAKILDAPALSL